MCVCVFGCVWGGGRFVYGYIFHKKIDIICDACVYPALVWMLNASLRTMACSDAMLGHVLAADPGLAPGQPVLTEVAADGTWAVLVDWLLEVQVSARRMYP